ncbi:hypothetical protein REPUB_Repub04eG0025400 [Reevesia pubescens]
MDSIIIKSRTRTPPHHHHCSFSPSRPPSPPPALPRVPPPLLLQEKRKELGNEGSSKMETSRRNSSNRRKWTNILVAINVLICVAQLATQGRLLLWGAKINSLIDKGQIWRLATSSLLHANIGQLMKLGAATSYWFFKAPAVGASGAIFGLVGSVAVFVMRNIGMIRDAKEDLQHIAQVIFLNMVIGLTSKGIDNWGHLGGLLGGAAMSWLLGPAWKYESMASNGRRIFSDHAPVFYLIERKRKPPSYSYKFRCLIVKALV